MARKKPITERHMFSAIESPLEIVDVCHTLEEALEQYRPLGKSSRKLVQHVDLRKITVLHSAYEKSGRTKMEDETIYSPDVNYGRYFVILDEDGKSTLRTYKTLSGAVNANPILYTPSQELVQLVREVIVDANLKRRLKREENNARKSLTKQSTGGHYSSARERID